MAKGRRARPGGKRAVWLRADGTAGRETGGVAKGRRARPGGKRAVWLRADGYGRAGNGRCG